MIRKPDVFIVGAPKCGTTAMDRYLAGHPDVFMARKEMHVFGADLRFGSQFYRRDPYAYLQEFSSWSGQQRIGESSVWYLFSTQAAREIKEFSPDARVIIMLREPAEMLHSLHHSFRFDANENLPTFEAALAAEEDRRAGRGIPSETYFAQGLAYRATARFADQCKRYFDVFGRERVHVIIYDDLAADTAAAYRATLEFLGVDSRRTGIDFGRINGSQEVKSRALRSVLRNPLICSTVLAVRPFMPRAVFSAMQKVEARLRNLNCRPAKKAPMTPELRRQLKREFAPDVERLSALLGRDLTHWSRDASEPKSLAKETSPARAEKESNLVDAAWK